MGTSFLAALQSLFGMLDELTPEFIKLIDTTLPGLKSAEMNRRIARCVHLCRVKSLNKADIMIQIQIDFSEQNHYEIMELEQLIPDEVARQILLRKK